MDNHSRRRRKRMHNGPNPVCPTCGNVFEYRAKRNFLVRIFLFWYPVKRYFCTTCLVCRHIFIPRFK